MGICREWIELDYYSIIRWSLMRIMFWWMQITFINYIRNLFKIGTNWFKSTSRVFSVSEYFRMRFTDVSHPRELPGHCSDEQSHLTECTIVNMGIISFSDLHLDSIGTSTGESLSENNRFPNSEWDRRDVLKQVVYNVVWLIYTEVIALISHDILV
jgi:hypothetical protein